MYEFLAIILVCKSFTFGGPANCNEFTATSAYSAKEASVNETSCLVDAKELTLKVKMPPENAEQYYLTWKCSRRLRL